MSLSRFPAARIQPWRASGPLLAVAALASAWWFLGLHEERVLYAAADPTSEDLDDDGLVDHQEEVLGSNHNDPDTDNDGFDDLIELARGSDLNNAVSVPAPQLMNVGMTARSDDGVLTVLSAIYVCNSEFPDFGYVLGVSVGGSLFTLPASLFLPASKISLHQTLDPFGWVIVLETKLPESILQTYGYLGFFSTVSADGASGPLSAAVVNMFDFDGYSVALLPAPPDFSGGGSIYKPLPRGDDLPSSPWTAEEICWQMTSVVGTDGPSLVMDIEDADCIPMTSKCHAASCQAGIGTTVKVLDAGALAGGG